MQFPFLLSVPSLNFYRLELEQTNASHAEILTRKPQYFPAAHLKVHKKTPGLPRRIRPTLSQGIAAKLIRQDGAANQSVLVPCRAICSPAKSCQIQSDPAWSFHLRYVIFTYQPYPRSLCQSARQVLCKFASLDTEFLNSQSDFPYILDSSISVLPRGMLHD